MAYDVVVTGHLCADLLPETSRIPLSAFSSPGKLFEIGPLEIATGGSVSNTGLALHRLGVNTGLMTTVGDDLLGRVIIAKLKDRDPRLGERIKVRENEASSYSVILSPENEDRIILHCSGNNERFTADDIDFDLVGQSKMFHLGYPPLLPMLYANDGDGLYAIFQRVYQMGVITSLDMALPDPNGPSGQVDWKRILARVLPYVDIFLPSLEEITFMLRRKDYYRWQGNISESVNRAYVRDLTDELLAMGAAISGIKLGEYGFYLRTTGDLNPLNRLQRVGQVAQDWQNLDLWQPAFAVQVVGTTGAGDSAYGGFLAAMMRGLSPAEVMRVTCAVGACNTEATDATSGVQSWDDTRERLEAGWPTKDAILPD